MCETSFASAGWQDSGQVLEAARLHISWPHGCIPAGHVHQRSCAQQHLAAFVMQGQKEACNVDEWSTNVKATLGCLSLMGLSAVTSDGVAAPLGRVLGLAKSPTPCQVLLVMYLSTSILADRRHFGYYGVLQHKGTCVLLDCKSQCRRALVRS